MTEAARVIRGKLGVKSSKFNRLVDEKRISQLEEMSEFMVQIKIDLVV